jgi:uncharacterized protein YbjT (DUF2867 family)
VIGGSREIGKEICLAAAERGHHVRALSRSGSAPSGAGGAIEPMRGNALDRAYADTSRQEDMITESGLDDLIVRPGVLTHQARSGRCKVLTSPKSWRNGVIARAHVADYLANHLGDATLGGGKPVLIRWPL